MMAFAGALSLLCALVLLLIVIARHKTNPLAIWTIAGASAGGLATLLGPKSQTVAMVAGLILAAAALPALVGGLGLLLVPPAGLLLWIGLAKPSAEIEPRTSVPRSRRTER